MKKSTVKREYEVREEGETERERWIKETQQLKIERTYPTMKMVFGELL